MGYIAAGGTITGQAVVSHIIHPPLQMRTSPPVAADIEAQEGVASQWLACLCSLLLLRTCWHEADATCDSRACRL